MDPSKDPQQDRNDRDERPPPGRPWLVLVLLSLVGVLVLSTLFTETRKQKTYSEFMSLMQKNRVSEVVIFEHRKEIEVTTRSPREVYRVNLSPEEIRPLAQELRRKKVAFSFGQPSSGEILGGNLLVFLPFVLLAGVLIFMMRQAGNSAGSQVFSFGKSRARRLGETSKITFKDVAGVEEAKEEMAEVVDFLKDPGKFSEMGAKIPRGILLVGPPGSGKTLLAKAIAGEAGVPFFFMSGSDFVEMFVGVGASRVRDLFSQAKRNAPCLVFIDEIDAVGRQRGAGLGGGHDEREQTLNQLLVEMDGFEPNSGVILLAATNRPDVLDPALQRPGRFDRNIVVDNPDARGREDILRIHVRDKPIGPDVDLNKIARRAVGFSGADLANVCNEAAILAVRRSRKTITMDDFNEAMERSYMGPQRKSRMMKREERYMTAIHEGGHALAARFTSEAMDVHKITILPRGRALGVTMLLPAEDQFSKTRKELLADIVVSLGGLVAEQQVFSDITTGAAGGDLKQITAMARAMVMEYGMSQELGPISYGHKHAMIFLGRDMSEERNYSEAIAEKIDLEVQHLVATCRARCEDILTRNRDVLLALADLLMEEETVSGDELDTLIEDINGEPPPTKTHRKDVAELMRAKSRRKHAQEPRNGGGPGRGLENTQAGLVNEDDMLFPHAPTPAPPAPVPEPEEALAPALSLPQSVKSNAAAQSPVPPPAAQAAPPPEPAPAPVAVAPAPSLLSVNPHLLPGFSENLKDIKSRIQEKLATQDAEVLRLLRALTQMKEANDYDSAREMIRQMGETAKGDLDIYLHMELGEVYLAQEKVADAVKEYMRVLMLGAVKLGQQSERVIISFVRYLKIVDSVISKNGVRLGELAHHPDLVKETNALYEEWEHRVGYPKG